MIRTLNSARICAVLGTALLVTLATGCEDFLQVEDPGRYTDESLNTPLAMKAVANGVEGDLWGAYDDFVTFHGLLSDEFMHTGTWAQWEDMDQGRVGPAFGTDNGVFDSFVQRRTAANKAEERFLSVMGDTANRSEVMARVATVAGWVELLLGMHACEGPKEAGGAIVPDVDLYKQAIPMLTRAADISRTASNQNYERLAIAGRARAKLLSGDLAGALTDAQTIPDSYVFNAKYSETGSSNGVATLAHYSRLKAGGLDTRQWARVDTIARAMRDPFTTQLDMRVQFSRQGNGADGVKKFYGQEKYKTPSDDIRMTSGWEMRLIEAEVYLKQGNLTQAIAQINKVRANAGLTAHSATGLTAAQVQERLLWERFAELYLEGQRVNDLVRFNLVSTVMGTGRAPKFPMSTSELNLNPNTNGNTQGRCPAGV